MDEKIAAKVNALLEEVYATGIRDGREQERSDMVSLLSGPRAAPRTRTPRTRLPQAPVEQPPVASPLLTSSVKSALYELRADHPDGVFPDTITEYVKAHHTSNGGNHPSSRDIRQTLRQMMVSGQARRVQRGRYLPVDNAPPPGTLFHTAPPAA